MPTYNGSEGDDVFNPVNGNNTYNGLGGADRFGLIVGPITSLPAVATLDGGAGTDLFDVTGAWRQIYTHTNFTTGLVSTVTPLPYTLTAGTGGDVVFAANVEYADSESGPLSVAQNGAILRNIETARFIFSSNPNNPGDFAVLSGAGWYRHNPHDILIIGNLAGTALTGAITFDGGAGDDQLNAVAAINQILGSGGIGNDILFGGSANDILSGGDGFDRLSGGGGSNVIDGGAGDDVVEYVNAVQGVHVDLNDGTVSNNGYGLTDTLTNIEHLTGSAFNDVLVGNAANNNLTGGTGSDVLIGLDGNDVLDGGTGAPNTMQGGRGDDTYIVSLAGDTLLELGGEGFDSVLTTVSVYRLRENFEYLQYTGAGAFTGLGNILDNFIGGGEGGDTLIGYEGADILNGGTGVANTLIGGLGDDSYVSNAVGDTLIELAGEGYDTVSTSLATYTLRDNFEELVFIRPVDVVGTGNASGNLIRGNVGNDVLSGLAGNDTLVGHEGDDVLRGGVGVDVLDGGSGSDTADYSLAAGGVLVNLGGGYVANDGDGGTDTLSSIENAIGSAFNDTLVGGNGRNVLNGGLGADILVGQDGDDLLIGGGGAANNMQGWNGDDTYRVSAAGDTVFEEAGRGYDTVETTLSVYMLPNDIEALVYIGSGGFTGTGNSLANRITGGAGADVIGGWGGNDILDGGLGIDTVEYRTSPGAVTVRLDLGVASDGYGGSDTLTGFENATGSAFDDLIFGNAGANVIDGGAGRDTLLGGLGDDVLTGGSGVANEMYGGGGNDRYVVSAVGDTLIENAGEGTDTVETVLSGFTLGANLETLIYTGSGAFTGRGNGLANVLIGGAGNDTLTGLGGNDTINGGLGDDTVVMSGLASDYVITWSGGFATVSDTTAGRDGVDTLYGVEHLRFSDGGIVNLTPPAAPAALAALLADPIEMAAREHAAAGTPLLMWEELF